MTPSTSTLFARDYQETVAKLRDNIAVVPDEDAAMIQLEADVAAAARRLRDANRSGDTIFTRGQNEGARASVVDDATTPPAPSYRDVRQAASDADRLQRHQQLAARGAALLAEFEGRRPMPAPQPEPAPSLFSR